MRRSAGILVYKRTVNGPQFLLVHPGGPFWKNKDLGAWSIPKGEFSDDEDPLTAAKREFFEETGQEIEGDFQALTTIKQKAGKLVFAWAVEGDVDTQSMASNAFKIEWPYKSGRWITVPEVDQWEWFKAEEALQKINPAQAAFIREVQLMIGEIKGR